MNTDVSREFKLLCNKPFLAPNLKFSGSGSRFEYSAIDGSVEAGVKFDNTECSEFDIFCNAGALKENFGVHVSSSMGVFLDRIPLATSLAVVFSDGSVSVASLIFVSKSR
ncbi:unnamed protein product [Amaranthus hypochondriacus]